MHDRILAAPDPVDLDDGLLPDEVVGPRDVHEGALLGLIEGYPPFENVVAVRRDGEAVVAASEAERGAVSGLVHGGGHLQLVRSEVHGCRCCEKDLGLGADADGDPEFVALLLGHLPDGEQMAGDQPDRDGVRAHDHHAVERDVLHPLVLGDDDPGGDVAPSVLGEVSGDGELHEVELVLDLPELGVVDHLAGGRMVHRVEDVGDDPVATDVQRCGHLLPGGEPVAQGPPSIQVLEQYRGALALHEDAGGGAIVPGDVFLDAFRVRGDGILDCHGRSIAPGL